MKQGPWPDLLTLDLTMCWRTYTLKEATHASDLAEDYLDTLTIEEALTGPVPPEPRFGGDS